MDSVTFGLSTVTDILREFEKGRSHSPDLLDNPDIPIESLLAVDNEDGSTRIGPIDVANREVLRDKLLTPGELLRQSQLAPDRNAVSNENERQLWLFDLGGR
jgi:hypothetical protein